MDKRTLEEISERAWIEQKRVYPGLLAWEMLPEQRKTAFKAAIVAAMEATPPPQLPTPKGTWT